MLDPSNPITSRDWFLHDLFNDPHFIDLRDDFLEQVAKYDLGLSQLIGRPMSNKEAWLLGIYSSKASDIFDIDKEVAKKGLYYSERLTAWGKDRRVTAQIEGSYITIAIGAETRVEDIKKVWSSTIAPLQDSISTERSKRLTPSRYPSLAYIIHKHLLQGRKMSEIHRDYMHSRLEGYDGEYGVESYSEFTRHYKNAVSGIKKTP
ncbi:hypothetical protein GX865_01835 [Candidatus Saccharibacteria bacterium]|jgi:hypothetical protein|nr:hypothetical protein [Candidatus Saccharibacteria bacterium]